MRPIIRLIKKEFRRKLKMEYISENFDKDTFGSLLNGPKHEEIKEILNLDDNQIHLILAIFDQICSKYGSSNKYILAYYLLLVSIRSKKVSQKFGVYKFLMFREFQLVTACLLLILSITNRLGMVESPYLHSSKWKD
jgi:hypothetical protein